MSRGSGWKHTQATKDKISLARRILYRKDPDLKPVVKKSNRRQKGFKCSFETRVRMKEAHARRDPSYREKISVGKKRYWAGVPKEERQRILSKAIAANRSGARITSIQRDVMSILDSVEVKYQIEKRIGSYSVDIYISSRRLIVECDGDYWHDDSQFPGVAEHDARRDVWMLERRYSVLRLREYSIRSGIAAFILLREVKKMDEVITKIFAHIKRRKVRMYLRKILEIKRLKQEILVLTNDAKARRAAFTGGEWGETQREASIAQLSEHLV